MKHYILTALVLIVVLGITLASTNIPFRKLETLTGDEPHYILAAKAMYVHKTLDLAQAYGDRAFYEAFYGSIIDPHISPNSVPPHHYSIHHYGFPVLLVPAVVLGHQLGDVPLTSYCFMSLLMLLAAVFLFRVFRDVGLSASVALGLCLTAFCSAPLIVFSKYVYTETPAVLAMCVLLAMLYRTALKRGEFGWVSTVAYALIIAAIPWLHAKYVILSAGYVLAIMLMRIGVLRGTVICTTLAISLLCMAGLFEQMYGEFSISAQYHAPFSLRYAASGLVGLFADQRVGLLTAAPFYALAICASAHVIRRCKALYRMHPRLCVAMTMLTLNAIAFMSIATMHTNQDMPQCPGTIVGRFVLALLPLSLVLIAIYLRIVGLRMWHVLLMWLSVCWGMLLVTHFPDTIFVLSNTHEEGHPLVLHFSHHEFELQRLLPNLTSAAYEFSNLLLGSIALATLCVAAYTRAFFRRRMPMTATLVIGVVAYIGVAAYQYVQHDEPKHYDIHAVAPPPPEGSYIRGLEFYTRLGQRDPLAGHILSDPALVNYPVAYGPYKRLLRGRYRAVVHLEYNPKETPTNYKDVYVDVCTYRGAVIYDQVRCDARQLDRQSVVELRFDHDLPRHPIEIRAFVGGEPVQGFAIRRAEIDYLGPLEAENPAM